jgi:hypothetical protein
VKGKEPGRGTAAAPGTEGNIDMAKAETKQSGRNRWYPHTCGESHPSITTLLGVIASQKLMGWMAKNGTKKLDVYHQSAIGLLPDETIKAIDAIAESRWVAENETAFWKSGKMQGDEAADIGTMAHAWIESHLKGVDVGLEALPKLAQNAITAFLAWEKLHKLEVLKTEQTFYNCPLHYAGTADCVAMVDGELTLLDWKTSKAIWLEMVLQAWGYALADETSSGSRLYRQVAIGRFGKDGVPDVKIFKRNEFPGIEIARNVITSCGHIFGCIQEWEKQNPYIPKKKEKINA